MRIRCLFVLLLLSAAAFAQSDTSFTHTITKTKGGPPPTSNDFWFAMPQNYELQGGKYVMLYMTSDKTTTVNVAITGGTTYRFPIKAYTVASFSIPMGWEVTTSGIIEDKGIHVWSNDADLTAYVLSRNPATSDGTNILPLTAWATEYVVGAYHSLYGGINSTLDYPSQFMVFAAYDSTVITITPSANIRKNNAGLVILHPKDVPFTVVLDKGQCIQYMATLAENATDYDMTGTVITSTKPVGVIGATQCANIPVNYPYCDFICEMIPPVSSWGNAYQSLPYANRKGGDSFLIISSKNGQEIYRNGALAMMSTKKHDTFFRADITDASTWTSDAPFMLAQYINSTTFTDDQGNDNAGIGDPAMMMHLPTTKYSDTVVFQVPTIPAGQGGFSNYANVIVHDSAIAKTTFDGQSITQYKATNRIKIPYSKYTGFRVRSLSQGAHVVASDSGVGVNVYGYGSYDSYAWSGPVHVDALPSSDTVSPLVVTTGNCNCATIIINDSIAGGSGISAILSDSLVNMSITDDPSFIYGSGKKTTFYTLCATDQTKDAYAEISIVDMAGNRTTVVSTTKARVSATVWPSSLRIPYPGADIANFTEYTITNTTPATLVLSGADGLHLSKGNVGFSLVSPDLSDLMPAASRVFLVKYISPNSFPQRDTLLLGNECDLTVTPVTSFNPVTETAAAYGMELPCIYFGAQIEDSAAYLVNDLLFLLTVDSITIDDNEHFKLLSPSFPATLDLGDTLYAVVRYDASVEVGFDTSLVHFYTQGAGEFTAIVKACIEATESVRNGNASNYNELAKMLQQGLKFSWLSPAPNPSVSMHPVSFTFGLSHSADVTLELFDISGKRAALIMDERFAPGIHERYLETIAIARGAYIYRYTIEGQSYTGKLVVE